MGEDTLESGKLAKERPRHDEAETEPHPPEVSAHDRDDLVSKQLK